MSSMYHNMLGTSTSEFARRADRLVAIPTHAHHRPRPRVQHGRASATTSLGETPAGTAGAGACVGVVDGRRCNAAAVEEAAEAFDARVRQRCRVDRARAPQTLGNRRQPRPHLREPPWHV